MLLCLAPFQPKSEFFLKVAFVQENGRFRSSHLFATPGQAERHARTVGWRLRQLLSGPREFRSARRSLSDGDLDALQVFTTRRFVIKNGGVTEAN